MIILYKKDLKILFELEKKIKKNKEAWKNLMRIFFLIPLRQRKIFCSLFFRKSLS